MTFWGETADGTEILLGEAAKIVLDYERDVPADALTAVFPADGIWEPLCFLSAYDGERQVFGGIVDEQAARCDEMGLTVTVVCRSLAAILLDNEAAPMTLRNPSLRTVFETYIKPLGFTEITGDLTPKNGEMTVRKGESCWSVLETFAGRFLRQKPVVDPAGCIMPETDSRETLRLEQPVSAAIIHRNCKRVSDVAAQGRSGAYDHRYENKNVVRPRRRRYLSARSAETPERLIRRGEESAFAVKVTVPGLAWCEKNAAVDVDLGELGAYEGCIIHGMTYRLDKSGERTAFELKIPVQRSVAYVADKTTE